MGPFYLPIHTPDPGPLSSPISIDSQIVNFMAVAVKNAGEESASIRSDEGGGEGVGVGEGEIDIGGKDKMFIPVFRMFAHIDELVRFGDLVREFGGAIAVGVISVRTR